MIGLLASRHENQLQRYPMRLFEHGVRADLDGGSFINVRRVQRNSVLQEPRSGDAVRNKRLSDGSRRSALMHGTVWIGAAAVTLAVAAQNGQVPAARSCSRITIVVPRDAWRLSVETNGSARINFAALPQTADVRVGTFRFRKLHSELAARATPTEERERAGTVEFTRTLDGRKVRRYLSDERYAADLFEQAWAHVVTDPDEVGRQHVEMLRGMWNRRDRPRRQ